MFVSKLTPEQWAEARRLRAEGASFAAIATRFALTDSTVASRARREGWPSLTGPSARGGRQLLGPRAAVPSPSTAHVRRALARRMLRILDIELTIMELRMSKLLKAARASMDDSNAEFPDLGKVNLGPLQAAIKDIDKVTELESDADPTAGGRGTSRSAAASEADVFRREIAERIEKLIPPC